MVLIRCPQCGQRVLNVATKCPKCSFLLIQNPNQEGGDQNLAECRRCGKMVDRQVVVCPFCAYPARARRRLRVAMWTALGLVAAASAAILGTQIRAESRGGSAARAPRPATTTPPVPRDTATAGDPGPQRPTQAGLPARRDTVAPVRLARPPAPRDTAPVPQVTAPIRIAPRPAAATPADSVGAALPPDLRTRWTLNWVNVREGRGVDFPVVRVLRPGMEVQIRDARQGGWWEVYFAGERLGYIAGSELSELPPPDTLGAPTR